MVTQSTFFVAFALGHFFVTALILLGDILPFGYFFYNVVYILGLAWLALQPEAKEPLSIVFVICVMTICLDVVSIISYFPLNPKPVTVTTPAIFIGGFAGLQLFCHMCGFYLLCRDYSYRGGNMQDLFIFAKDFNPKGLYQRLSQTLTSTKTDENGNVTEMHTTSVKKTETSMEPMVGSSFQPCPPENQADFTTDVRCQPYPLTSEQEDPWRVYRCRQEQETFRPSPFSYGDDHGTTERPLSANSDVLEDSPSNTQERSAW